MRERNASPAQLGHATTYPAGRGQAALDEARAPVIIESRLALELHAVPLLGIVGITLVYWSKGSEPVLFAVGLALVLAAALFARMLRARLIARVQRRGMLRGLSADAAYTRAVTEVERILDEALRRAGRDEPAERDAEPRTD